MECPFGHSHGHSLSHSHRHRRNDDDDDEKRGKRPPQRPTYYQMKLNISHGDHVGGRVYRIQHGFNQFHSALPPGLADRATVKVYCKADPSYHLAIRDGKVVLMKSNRYDLSQHWIKDERCSTIVRDKVGYPGFALVNKATGQAIKHSIGATQPVQLIGYRPDHPDESVLWSESKDTGEEYKAIRMINNIRLNMDAFNGKEKYGGVCDGTVVVLWKWGNGENQRWKIEPHTGLDEVEEKEKND